MPWQLQISIPFFGDLLGFIGAFAFGPTTFWLVRLSVCLSVLTAPSLLKQELSFQGVGCNVSVIKADWWPSLLQPPLIFLIIMKPPVSSVHWWASWFCIIFGLIVTILGAPAAFLSTHGFLCPLGGCPRCRCVLHA